MTNDDTLPVWDPHFHIFDLREQTANGQDPQTLPAPGGEPVYEAGRYEDDLDAAGPGFRHLGGAWLEAVSVCHPDRDGAELNGDALAEARWASNELRQRERRYVLVGSAALEAGRVDETLTLLAADPAVRGVRQILNHRPSWPRNDRLGDVLQNPDWRRGYHKLADHRLSFDLQLNPHQFAAAAALIRETPETPVILNHLGTPTFDDLQRDDFWQGLAELAACDNVTLKISMLYYAHPDWDRQRVVTDAISRAIDLFGVERCFFASNFPVDRDHGWPAKRLYAAFRRLAETLCGRAEQRRLFAENAMRVYRAG